MPEKILVMGAMGTGKTYQALKIAEAYPSAQVYVLDTDDAWERNMTEFPPLGNVHITYAYDWEEYLGWLDDIEGKVRPGLDWVVVDRVDKAWAAVQTYVSEEVYGVDRADKLLAGLKAMAQKGKQAMRIAGATQADWQVINAQYFRWFSRLMYKLRANVYLTTSISPVYRDDDQRVLDLYAHLGVRPAGQKDLAYEPSTVLLFTRDRDGRHYVTTVKDRGREYMDHLRLISLPKQYLARYTSNASSPH